MANIEEVLKLLCSHVKLERDRGISSLEKLLSEKEGLKNNPELISSFSNSLTSLVQSADKNWEIRHGGLLGAKIVILAKIVDEEFLENMKKNALILIHDEEFRVRILAGEVLGALCQVQGTKVYIGCKEEVLSSVSNNLERQIHVPDEPSVTDQLQKKMNGNQPEMKTEANKPADAAKIFHDTAGWKNLETSMRCLQSLIEGCGEAFNEHISQTLLDLIFQALSHTNRFVRETGYQVCGSLVSLGRPQDESLAATKSSISIENNAIVQHGDQFSSYLQKGLADNWSQVRMAASVATRQFLQTLPPQARERFYPKILPAMCLNRYYVAEGVRIYSQQTWKMVMGTEGKQLVEKYIKETVDFYINQTKADNHAVREAACSCIAELGIKVNPDCTRTYVKDLLDALIVCFKDDSWPVRDAACVACGNFILCFPEKCKSHMEELYPLFFTNLEDNIPSVRQGAAISLANVVKAYGKEETAVVFQKVKSGLKEVETQKENTEKYSGLEKGPATFGVVKKLRDNDMELHTNKQMYSCGSLAPKMGRGGGCMDHLFKRPPEPWEITDGCICLVVELADNAKNHKEVVEVLPLIAKAAGYRHYTQHPYLLETVCKQLPVLAKRLGKRMFKQYLELFFESIFYSVTSDNNLTSVAASECLSLLGQLLGPSILRGRVEIYNPRFLTLLDQSMRPGPPMY
ncbi:uncharacterized protein LOC116295668 [Actinia tenebrosa]|uniref:Uncharacterized protein LOC116295668 n=1 Tax=Actinia tenebrosa TaxID=6105 RepID=A0A6P8HVQ5_ACTTE|nr:uncharacterized protein LOC116295668 [Actinia tenebrosa]